MLKKHLHSLILTITLTLCYAATIAPGLTWANGGADGGDLIAAAATNGIAHPSGYPLYLLLARVFQFIPFGTLAFRTNLFSAICTIFAALVLHFFLRRQKISAGVALIATLAFGLSPAVWSQAVITEVYALQSLLLILFLWTLLDENIPGGDWTRGLAFGMAVSNHLTTLLLLPLLFMDSGVERSFTRPVWLIKRFFCLSILILCYFTLWLRAIYIPPINWGNPTTLENLWWLVSGRMYSSYPFDISLAEILLRIRAVGGLLLEQFSIPGVLLGIYGLFSGRIPRHSLLASGWMLIAFSGFAVFYGSYDSQVYLIGAYLAFSVWLAYGMHDIWQNLSPKLVKLTATLLIIGVMIRIPLTMPTVDASHDVRAEQFGANFVSSVPQNAIIFASDDQPVFALWYFHHALGERADVVIVAEELLSYPWYIQTLAHTYPTLKLLSQETSVAEIIHNNSNRPICRISNENINQPKLCNITP